MTSERSWTPQKGGNERIRGKRKDIQPRTRPRHLLSGAAERKTAGDTFNFKASRQRDSGDPETRRARARMPDSGSGFYLRVCVRAAEKSRRELMEERGRQGRGKHVCGDQRLPGVIFESRLKTEFALPNLTDNIFAERRGC